MPGARAIHLVAVSGEPDLIRALLAENVTEPASESAKRAGPPHHVAAFYGRIQGLEAFLDAGAGLEETDPFGRTTVYYAVMNEQPEAMLWLLERGANEKAKKKVGSTLLHEAAYQNAYECAELLLKREWDADVTDDDGQTPLHYAARDIQSPRSAEIVSLLLKNGANIAAKSTKDGRVSIHAAASSGHVKAIRILLDNNSKVDPRAKDGNTPLMIAAAGGHEDAVRLLLQEGASVHATNSAGKTALALAREEDHDDVVALLRSRGAH